MRIPATAILCLMLCGPFLAGASKDSAVSPKRPKTPGTYNAADDFSVIRNPSGVWSYGWKRRPANDLVLYASPKVHQDMTMTSWDSTPGTPPSVGINTGDKTIYPSGTIIAKPRQLILHPGANGEYSVVRWTAPENGNIRITGSFTGVSGHNNSQPTTTDVCIRVGNDEPFSSFINLQGKGNEAAFDMKAKVKKGETVEFVVGRGTNDCGFDSTALDATIQTQDLIRSGEAVDVVELRTGDRIRGTLKDKSLTLQAIFGTVTIPMENVLSLVNAGQARPRQLVHIADGQILGGRLDPSSLSMELSTGQLVHIPLVRILRFEQHQKAGNPGKQTIDKPHLILDAGDRLLIQLPTTPIDVVTRYGKLAIDSKIIASIVFETDEHGVHDILLTDGTHIAGLVAADTLELRLAGVVAPNQPVSVPRASVQRLHLAPRINSPAKIGLKLTNNDFLVGSFTGQLSFDTAFDTLSLNASEIRQLSRVEESATNLQLTLADKSVVRGQFQTQEVECRLSSGLTMKIPVALIEQYTAPPSPSTATTRPHP